MNSAANFWHSQSSRHDDQVDALAQLLDYVRSRWMYQPSPSVGGTLFIMNDDGIIETYGDDEFLDIEFDEYDEDPWGAC